MRARPWGGLTEARLDEPVGCFCFRPVGRPPGRMAACLMPVKFCRPVPGDRLDERTADDMCVIIVSYACHICVICASYLCHICVIYEQKFNFSAGRPLDRRKAQTGPVIFLCYIYNIKINKPRLHARAPHARLMRTRTRPPARITRARVKYT